MLKSFLYGLGLPLRALRLIFKNPKLVFWSALPALVTLGLYGFFLSQATSAIGASIPTLLAGWGWDPTGTLTAVATALLKLTLFILAAVTFSLVTSVVAAPFNDFLAEATEPFTTPALPKVEYGFFSAYQLRIILRDIAKTVVAGTLALSLTVLSWVPGINFAAWVGIWLLLAFQFLSYPQSRRNLPIPACVGFLFKNFWACAGFGLSLSVLFAIPLAASFFLPCAVVGGTLLFAKNWKPASRT